MEPLSPPRKRVKHYDIPGQARYLTFSCHRRQPFFKGWRSHLWFLKALRDAHRDLPFEL